MAPRMIAAQGTIPGCPEPEGIYLRENRSWYSPPGGWMAVQSGKWEQISVTGVALLAGDGGRNVFMAGLVFANAKAGDSGELRDQVGGKVGRWVITAATG